ncbi:ABC transporter permease [Hydrogenovibrio kuenenii]|uniref:ABC transporter permease n=1 Tax=Hydrogenovibrio kuenenii TaxID=63658 RepID=UPI0004B78B61|nr:ABC transporter permease [Hydrogenovibrio kuenenii]
MIPLFGGISISFFWTDIMIWGLLACIVIWAKIVGRSAQVKAQWHRVFESNTAMIAAIVLMVYFTIALLDSVQIHIAGANTQPGSFLDILLSHLIAATERTYSAPFALTEFNKSTKLSASGEVEQVYLPLQHIHAQASIMLQSVKGFGLGLVISAVLICAHCLYLASRQQSSFKDMVVAVWQKQTKLPWRTAYFTITLITIIMAWLFVLSFSFHVLGTDKVGIDVFYETLKSIRTGVLIGVLTTLVMLPIALTLGITAGLFRGWVDDVIQYIYTTLNSIPGVLLIAAAVLVMQVMINNHPSWMNSTAERADLRLLFLVLILGVTSWTGLCRLLRAETLKISQMEFVVAARAFGVSRAKVISRHILPNVMHIVLISVVLDFSSLVLAEAVLSYVGVGVDPTMNSWGNMINQARLEMARDPMVWWSLFSAFVFMFILVLAANLFSDRVQTVLNPREANN